MTDLKMIISTHIRRELVRFQPAQPSEFLTHIGVKMYSATLLERLDEAVRLAQELRRLVEVNGDFLEAHYKEHSYEQRTKTEISN